MPESRMLAAAFQVDVLIQATPGHSCRYAEAQLLQGMQRCRRVELWQRRRLFGGGRRRRAHTGRQLLRELPALLQMQFNSDAHVYLQSLLSQLEKDISSEAALGVATPLQAGHDPTAGSSPVHSSSVLCKRTHL